MGKKTYDSFLGVCVLVCNVVMKHTHTHIFPLNCQVFFIYYFTYNDKYILVEYF